VTRDSTESLGEFFAGEGRTRIRAIVRASGEDLVVTVDGGVPHVGAVTLSEPGRRGQPRCGTLAALNHRESEITLVMGREIAAGTGRRTAVVAGIHLDEITREEITAVRANVRELIRRILAEMDLDPTKAEPID
jgi:hypothetical protein